MTIWDGSEVLGVRLVREEEMQNACRTILLKVGIGLLATMCCTCFAKNQEMKLSLGLSDMCFLSCCLSVHEIPGRLRSW